MRAARVSPRVRVSRRGGDIVCPIFCPVCGKEVPTHKLVYDFQERRIAGYRCACGFIHAAGLDPEDLKRMGWMEGYRQQCKEMRV